MRTTILASFLLFKGVAINAQPSTVERIRPGVKSVTRNICGYGPKGDSTGMKFYSYARYDRDGRLTNRGQTQTTLTESAPPKTALSWYYYAAQDIKPGVDSVRYIYSKEGKITEVRYRSRSGERRRIVYTYDSNGNCIREEHYDGAADRLWTTFSYDQKGVLLKSTSGVGPTERKTVVYAYDSLGRIVSKISTPADNPSRKDTTTTSYSEYGHMICTSGMFRTCRETLYTEYDSVKAIYVHYYRPGKIPSDTTLYEYDQITHRRVKTIFSYGQTRYTLQYEYNGGKLAKRITKTGDVVTAVTIYNENEQPVSEETFDKNGNGRWSSEYWMYNAQHDLIDYKLRGASGELLQHEVYSYMYY